MAQVNFYALGSSHDETQGPLLAACRVAEKACALGHRVYVWLADDSQASSLNQLMWAYRPASFLPHELIDAGSGSNAPVLLGSQAPSPDFGNVVINLSGQRCEQPESYTRVNEVVGPDEQSLADGRLRFREYQQAGHTLEHFKL